MKLIRIAASGLLTVLLFSTVAGLAAEDAAPGPDADRCRGTIGIALDHYLRAAEAFGFAGVVLAEIQGEIVLHRGYGLADRQSGREHAIDTVFDIGSIAKTMSAAAFLRQGKSAELLAMTIGDVVTDAPADKRDISLRRLLSHTSGLPRDVEISAEAGPRDVIRTILASPLREPPGTAYRYSNAGFQLVAAFVQQMSPHGWQHSLRDTFRAAGLRDTSFYGEAPARRVARGYFERDDGGSAADWHFSWSHTGSGAVLSTAGDLHRWIRAMKQGHVVDAATWNEMQSPTSLNNATKVPYGLGWQVEAGGDVQEWIGHAGDNLGYHCVLAHFERPDATLIVCCNEGFVYDGLGNYRAVQPALSRILLGQAPHRSFPEPQTLSADQQRQLVGRYSLPDGGAFEISIESNRLWIAPVGQRATELLLAMDRRLRTAARRAVASSVTLVDALQDDDLGTARRLTTANWFLSGLDRYLETPGPSGESRVEVLGALPVTWSPTRQIRVFMRATAADGSHRVFNLGWQGPEPFDFTRWDHAQPHARRMSAIGKNEFAICDLWTKRSRRFTIDDQGLQFEDGDQSVRCVRQEDR